MLIIVHELGHLFIARVQGIKAETFSIGFGPRIAGMKIGATNFILSLIPFGGYVQLDQEPPKDTFLPGSAHFTQRPPLHKILVVLAGPVANLVLAVVVMAIVLMLGIRVPAYMKAPPVIGWVKASSPVAIAGVRAGDTILEINGVPVKTWRSMINQFSSYSGQNMTIRYLRDGNASAAHVSHVSRMNTGLYPLETITVQGVRDDSPAQQAGLINGDIVTAINGRPLLSWVQFLDAVADSEGPMAVNISRSGQSIPLQVTPAVDPKVGRKIVGISFFSEEVIEKHAFPGVILTAIQKVNDVGVDSITTVWGLIRGQISMNNVGSVISIAQSSGQAARMGMVALLTFLAFLSVQLCIFNLLPFLPAVDGGQIMIFLYEMVIRRPLSAVTLERLAKVGWAMAICLLIALTYNDIMKLL